MALYVLGNIWDVVLLRLLYCLQWYYVVPFAHVNGKLDLKTG